MGFSILLWIISGVYCTASELFCEPILGQSQLSKTGLIALNRPTVLKGIITVRSEQIPFRGVLEFLIEHENNEGDSEEREPGGVEDYDALIRIEFTGDKMFLSSRIGEEIFGKEEFILNVADNSKLTLQLLGSDEVADNTYMIKIFGNILERKSIFYHFYHERSENWKENLKIPKIFKTFGASMFYFCSSSVPGIVCEPDLFHGSNSKESLKPNNDLCIETLFVGHGEERLLTCIGYGAPDMTSEWETQGEQFQLVKIRSDSETSYKGNYAFQTTRKLLINDTSQPGMVICTIRNNNFDFPVRECQKTFIITINTNKGVDEGTFPPETKAPCTDESCSPPKNKGKTRPNITLYIMSSIMGSAVISALFVITIAVCRKRRGILPIQRSESERSRIDPAPNIPVPPVPVLYERQATAATNVSSCTEADPEVDHVYETIDDIQDPADYCYAWTVSDEALRNSKVGIKMVLSPTVVRRSQGFGRQSSVGQHSMHSSSGGSGYQRTYFNTSAVNYTPVRVEDAQVEPEYVPAEPTHSIRGRVHRQSLSEAEGVLSLGEVEVPVRRNTMVQPILRRPAQVLDLDSAQLVAPMEQI